MREKGTLYFFTGLAGAGKTTIGGLFYERLQQIRPDAILSDEAQRRQAAAKAAGVTTGDGSDDEKYTTEYRYNNAFRLFEGLRAHTEQGRDVVCCSMCLYADVRAKNREIFENYREIYIKVGMETLYARNQRGLYSSGRKNVVGVDLPWDEPEHPDIVIQNDTGETPESIVDRLFVQFGLDEPEREAAQ